MIAMDDRVCQGCAAPTSSKRVGGHATAEWKRFSESLTAALGSWPNNPCQESVVAEALPHPPRSDLTLRVQDSTLGMREPLHTYSIGWP